ncbi:MAG: metalloregulator ArsR/SmtB family transcription factor [Oscillospiraceae bacterium]
MKSEHSEICDCNVIHEDVIARVSAEMPEEDPIYEVSELFKVFGDSTRARILCALEQSELCVCDLSALLGMTQSAISHQLRILKSARMAKCRRAGKVVYYSLADDHIKRIFDLAFEHIAEE